MLLHTIVEYDRHRLREIGLPITRDVLIFKRFIQEEIFPGGQLPQPQWVIDGAQAAGFTAQRIDPLQQRYTHTLDHWSAALARHHTDAVGSRRNRPTTPT